MDEDAALQQCARHNEYVEVPLGIRVRVEVRVRVKIIVRVRE